MFFIKKKPGVIAALEVGSHKVVAAVAEVREDGSLILRGVGEASSSGVRKGEVFDFQNAQKDISSALLEAENNADVEIQEVYLSITGSHIKSRKVRVKTSTEDEDHLVTEEQVRDLDEAAGEQAIPEDHAVLHELLQHYTLDSRTQTIKPVGLCAKELEADYLLIHGLQTRLETVVRCVMELDIQVSGVVLSSYATAQSFMASEVKKQGAVVIDLGSGTSDYMVYIDGAVAHIGVLGVGGDHLTHDISLGLKLPYKRSEELKIRHGLLYPTGIHQDEQVTLERSTNSEERSIYLHSLAKIMYLRQRETLELIKKDLDKLELWERINGGVHITGGASQVEGMQKLATDVFPVPVRLAHEFQLEGDQTYSRRPDLAGVLGVLRYARNYELTHPRSRGWSRVTEGFSKMFSSIGLF
ncbi:MAG: cell division protein FtsA [Verrucomicrobiota bacterium]